ncbi:MAG TPA: DNA polymerase III subunit beta [Thermoanaerobaculia bacterium]
MELTVAKADLQKELQLCQGVVEKRSTIPILSNVLLKAADGRLQIAATDLDVTILSSCAARVTTPGGVTIEAKRLFDIIRSLPDDDVHMNLQENNSVLVESGTAKFRLLGLPAEDYPTLPSVDVKESYTIPLEELKTMVAKVKFAITHEETRFQLNGALLKVQPSKLEMVATDGHRMALINFPQGSGGNGRAKSSDLTILVPRKALEEILRLETSDEEGNVHFGVSDNHLFFEAGERKLLARMIDVNFPNYMEVISRDNDRHVMVDRERLLSTIRRISLVAKADARGALRLRAGEAHGVVDESGARRRARDGADRLRRQPVLRRPQRRVRDGLSLRRRHAERRARSEGREFAVHRQAGGER